MTRVETVLALTFAGTMCAQPVTAQPPPAPTAIVTTIAAPVFRTADGRQAPIGVATLGSTLRVIETTEGWYRVNFDDPQTGLRVRFIQMKDVRLLLPNSGHLLLRASGSTAPQAVQSWPGQIFD